MSRVWAGVVVAWGCALLGVAAAEPTGRIVKVLPHLLDIEGRNTLSPSLYERDAYQAMLRKNPALRGGLRFDIEWKTSAPASQPLTLRIEMRGSQEPQVLTLDQLVHRRPWYNRWTAVTLPKEVYARLGELVAWRVSLWDGPRLLGDQRSFLW